MITRLRRQQYEEDRICNPIIHRQNKT